MYSPTGCDDAGRRRVGAKEGGTMYTLKEAMRVLGIGDVRTLHALLKQAGGGPARGEQDKRQRVLTPEKGARLGAVRGEGRKETTGRGTGVRRGIGEGNRGMARI